MIESKFKRPEVLSGHTSQLKSPCGSFFLTLNECDDKLCEVRMCLGKSGTCQRMLFEVIAILISVLLQENISREKIKKTLQNRMESCCDQTIWSNGERYSSCIDYAIKRILEDLASRGEVNLD